MISLKNIAARFLLSANKSNDLQCRFVLVSTVYSVAHGRDGIATVKGK